MSDVRIRLTFLTGLALVALVTGCSTTQVSQGPPAPGDLTNVIHGNTTNRTLVGNKATSQPNPGGLSVGTPVNSTNPALVVPISNALPLSKQNAKPLTSVSFVTDKIGFIGSQNGTIYKTTDGGATWTTVYTASEPIVGVEATGTSANQYFVVAWTKNYMVTDMAGANFSQVLFNGTQSAGFAPTPITDVSLVPSDYEGNRFLVFVSNGTVWSSNGGGASWLKRTPPAPVASVAALDPATWYAATSGGVIYKTTDGGNTWTKVFSTSLNRTQEWNVNIQASGNHVAVLYTCTAGAANQRPYILFESNDAGQTWNPLFDQSLFQSIYGNTKPPLDSTPPGAQAGPFALLPHGLIAFTGVYPVDNTITTISVITPQGKRVVYDPIGPSANTPSGFGASELPTAISAPDATHFFVVGGDGNKAVMEVSTDGGVTWTTK